MNEGALTLAVGAAALAALCAVADGALLSLQPGDRADQRLRGLYDDREAVHRTLSLARVILHLVAGAGVALGFGLALRPRAHAFAIAAGWAVLVVLLAENVARTLGDSVGAPAMLRLRRTVQVLERVLAPAVILGRKADARLQRVFPPRPAGEAEREAATEQFREVIAAEAEVSPREEALLAGVFDLADTAVRDIMMPRVDIVGIERSTPWSEMLDRVRSSEHARFPVYDETLDEIVGILYAKDLLPAVIADEAPDGGWPSLVRPAAFIPGTKTIDAQLRDFKASRTHIAIVVDEYGGTAGLLTIEDILEEIVGDIRDEYDQEEPAIESEEGERFWVSGRLTLDELSEALGHHFESEDVATVGGLVYEHLGRVPRAGERFALHGFTVVVERVRRRRIERVYFERNGHVDHGEGEE
jgi:CBS domain containing-hemolysin-like protein